jgi:hypothetical protein
MVGEVDGMNDSIELINAWNNVSIDIRREISFLFVSALFNALYSTELERRQTAFFKKWEVQ